MEEANAEIDKQFIQDQSQQGLKGWMTQGI